MYLELSSLSGFFSVVASNYRYNLFTAADEKIPLSVVRVNKKPQYLVFSLHFPHQPAKYGQLPVESSKKPRDTRTSAQSSTLCLMHIQWFQARRLRPLRSPSPSQIKPSPTPHPSQDAKSVHFPRTPVRSVEIWTIYPEAPPGKLQIVPRRLFRSLLPLRNDTNAAPGTSHGTAFRFPYPPVGIELGCEPRHHRSCRDGQGLGPTGTKAQSQT